MRYAKVFGLMLLMLSTYCVSAAYAAEGEVLSPSYPVESTTKDNGTATFEATGGAITVKCTSSAGVLKLKTSLSGSFDELFLGCTAGGFKCTGLADAVNGSLLFPGTFEVLAFKEGMTLKLAIIYTIEPVHFECLGLLTTIQGSVIGLITNTSGVKTKTLSSSLVGSGGKQSLTSVNGVNHHLESETNGSAFAEMSLNQSVTATVGAGEPEIVPVY
ncbi:MAG TPA: hypothetical protein VN618_12085 [Solirubrobacteraceae bacterium]|nr:hypothetical protein [Solirubrobacteraceae bacterium]